MRRTTCRATPLATRAPAAAMPVAARMVSPTGSVCACRSERSAAAGGGFDAAAGFAGRFSLRLPGRERGKFPRTPPSSVIGKESSPPGSGYSHVKDRPKSFDDVPASGTGAQELELARIHFDRLE